MKHVTRDGLVKILIITATFVFIFIAAYPFTPAARQGRRLAIAREHAVLVRPSLNADPRFAHVQVGAYTGDGGVFWVVGNVSSEDDLLRLRQLISESDPTIDVKWTVQVGGATPEASAASNHELHDIDLPLARTSNRELNRWPREEE